jgi:hypothetical protein
MNLRLPLTSAFLTLTLSGTASGSPSEAPPDSWTEAPRAFVMLRPDAPGRTDEFIRAFEAAGGHVSVIAPSQAAWVYATDEVLARPELRRWIRTTHRGRIPDSEIAEGDIRESRSARSWNQALEISNAMQENGSLSMHGLVPDVRTMPVPREGREGSFQSDRMTAPTLSSLTLSSSTHLPLGADSTDWSLFMAGSVVVGVWLIEAAGSEYDWSNEEEAQTIGGVMAGMDAWVRKGGAGASLSFVFDIHTAVPVSGVPILEDDSGRWVSEALTQAGFPGPPNYPFPPAYTQAITYNNWARDQFRTNWCFSIFIVDSDPNVNAGQLPGGGAAWAYLGGPYVYMSRYSTWAANAFAYYGVIPMHEVGHIFYATDEYDFQVDQSGYLYAEDNTSHPGCIMDQNDSSLVCQPTRNQLGWRDLDQDGIIEVLDTPPTISVGSTPISGQDLTWSGSAAVTIVPSQNPYFSNWVTIDRIERVELRVDAGPWIEAAPADGSWDGYVEGFQWTAPPLCAGSHVLRARAHTTAGSWSEILTIGFQSSGTAGTCGPWVDAPDSVIVTEGMVVEFSITATDPDGEPIEQLRADVSDLPVPNDASFQWSGSTGAFHWTTTPRDSGVHEVVFTATNSLSGSASTSLHVTNVDQPPVLSVPASIEGAVGAQIVFEVVATDPDGDPITYLSADLPTFATFEIRPGGGSGQFQWTPVDAQAGTHVIGFRASNLLQATASTAIHVAARPPNPVVTAPDTVHVEAGQEVSFFVEVFEPSGELVGIAASGLPPRATFRDNGDWTGQFRWMPEEADRPGSPYVVSFVATNPGGWTGQSTTVLMMKKDRAPVVVVPGPVTGTEGTPLEVAIAAFDPDGDPIQSVSASPLPAGAVFEVDPDLSHGTLRWTPDFTQSGSYPITVVARSASGTLESGPVLEGTATLQLTVLDRNRPPVADAGGPYQGVVAEPVAFEGGGSSDPDGDPLQLTWNFGDGVQATGAAATHAYEEEGTYLVVLRASDGTQVDTDSTTTEVLGYLKAEAFFAGRHRTISLAGGSSTACLQLEPVGASYENEDVDVATLLMRSEGTGVVSEISGEAGKVAVARDQDHDGVDEITICYRMADVRSLFSNLSGKVERTVSIRGRLYSGAGIRAEVNLSIVAAGVGISVSPNPLVSRATLTWRAEKS